jgi:hypothetical protein
MVQEYGEIDLARLLAKHEAARQQGVGGGEMDENFIRLYWQQMLQVGDCTKAKLRPAYHALSRPTIVGLCHKQASCWACFTCACFLLLVHGHPAK